MIAVGEFLAFVAGALVSPQGLVVACLFAALVWVHVLIMKLKDRTEARAHRAELAGILEGMPAPDRARKTLVPSLTKEPHRAA